MPPSNLFPVPLGSVVATAGAVATLTQDDIVTALRRHASGDWGNVPPEDRTANDESMRSGTRLLSAYRSAAGTEFWVITEADRSSTTVLLPDEY